jgi:poly-gamma-glutamate capsule biosynthesis protein CapA/YwtB (metallophosphatase superfamily)/poly(3-hydroxybutyrate) depolymerase
MNQSFVVICRRTFLHAILALFLCGGASAAEAIKLNPGAGRFEFTQAGKTVPVWYYLPENASAETPVLVVMHGVNRDADRYRNEWMPHAQRHGFILLAPEFSNAQFPGADAYNYGGTVDDKGRPQPREQWSFSFIEPIVAAAKTAVGNKTAKFFLYGHSAGAQFVHRYLYFVPDAPVAGVIAANAGWWTMPDEMVDFPYGLRGSPITEDALKTILQRPLVVLLGTRDTDPNHPNLRRTAEAMRQGPYRLVRGHYFFENGQAAALAYGVPFGWKLALAPGIGHVDGGMAASAVKLLFGEPPITGREPGHVRVLFGGDTSCGESYQDGIAKSGGVNVLVEKGYEHGLEKLSGLLSAADFRVINLETPLTAQKDSPLKTKDYLHYSDPVKVPQLFAKYRPLAFSLANNHTLDQGVPGLEDTFAALNGATISSFGAGMNLADAAKPLLQPLRIGDRTITLAVFGAFEYRKNYDDDFQFYARADRPGCAPADVPAVAKAIAELRKTTPDAYVAYFVHWGDNYIWKKESQTAMAHALREAGVDLVVGAHAHMLQEVERDARGWIFYGLGNLQFNAPGRYAAHKAPPFSTPLMIDFSMANGKLHAVPRIYPIVSDNQATGYQPHPVSEEELGTIESLLAEKGAWDAATRSAVKRGKDAVGPYLEFSAP